MNDKLDAFKRGARQIFIALGLLLVTSIQSVYSQELDEFLSVVTEVNLLENTISFKKGSISDQLPSYRLAYDAKIYFSSGKQAVLNSVKRGHMVSVVVTTNDALIKRLMISGKVSEQDLSQE